MNPPAVVPSGVLALVGGVVARQRQAERRCLERLARAGYEEVVLPVLEYAEEASGEGYRFVDRGGRVIALRTDFTPLAARVMAPWLSRERVVRICYAGEVVRPKPARLRELPELYQLGFECYGVAEGGEEACTLALELLAAAGIAPASCHVTVSVANLAQRLLARLGASGDDAELLEMIAARDLSGLSEALHLAGDARRFLEGALLGEPAASWGEFFQLGAELERLADLCARIEARGATASIDSAPALAGQYYRGLVFSVWGRRTRAVVAAGGEYEVRAGGDTVPAAGACVLLGVALEEAC